MWSFGRLHKVSLWRIAPLWPSRPCSALPRHPVWEMAIKAALGRADFQVSPATIVERALGSGFIELPVRSAAALRVASLPAHHRDPFDRLLVAQALTEPAALYTADAQLAAYSELVVLV
jgi:PIN domain nuclease of toxin-antitoxin system